MNVVTGVACQHLLKPITTYNECRSIRFAKKRKSNFRGRQRSENRAFPESWQKLWTLTQLLVPFLRGTRDPTGQETYEFFPAELEFQRQLLYSGSFYGVPTKTWLGPSFLSPSFLQSVLSFSVQSLCIQIDSHGSVGIVESLQILEKEK